MRQSQREDAEGGGVSVKRRAAGIRRVGERDILSAAAPAARFGSEKPARARPQLIQRWRALQTASTSSGSRVHQLLAEKISTSWNPR